MEITIDIDTSGIGKLPGRWEKARQQGLRESAETMVRFLMQNSPVDHGILNKWFIESVDEEQAVIKTPAEYAYWVNYGHRQEPGRFIPGKWEGDKFRYDPKAKVGMVLKESFVEGDHFVQQSMEQLQPLAPGFFLRALEESD